MLSHVQDVTCIETLLLLLVYTASIAWQGCEAIVKHQKLLERVSGRVLVRESGPIVG